MPPHAHSCHTSPRAKFSPCKVHFMPQLTSCPIAKHSVHPSNSKSAFRIAAPTTPTYRYGSKCLSGCLQNCCLSAKPALSNRAPSGKGHWKNPRKNVGKNTGQMAGFRWSTALATSVRTLPHFSAAANYHLGDLPKMVQNSPCLCAPPKNRQPIPLPILRPESP